MKLKKPVKKAAPVAEEKPVKKSTAPAKKNKIDLPDVCRPADLATLYAAQFDCDERVAEAAIKNTMDVICNAVVTGHTVQFVGTMTFAVSERAARKGRNPHNGETIDIPAQKSIRLKVGATLKKALNA